MFQSFDSISKYRYRHLTDCYICCSIIIFVVWWAINLHLHQVC